MVLDPLIDLGTAFELTGPRSVKFMSPLIRMVANAVPGALAQNKDDKYENQTRRLSL
ncbi:hypothetical protein [Primorskyibacter flagellatus]|uniref:hypothetical protein n=1 Tax=Primorskyibacter flagellatus TaxID=1387277 RepID=UPI0015C48F1D|nr:hypothetical protein [Primorskyibacter flagellatus]